MNSDSRKVVIQMENVSIASAIAPTVPIIRQVDWVVNAGDYWIVGGLPGSGKSDLLATAAGLLRHLEGDIRILGHNLAEVSEDTLVQMRLKVGLVFPNEGRLFSHLSVADNLALPICYHRNCSFVEAWDRVEAIMEFTGLSDLADSMPGHIPRNLRQRVGLARALAVEPEILLLDDPLRGMDPRQVRWWMDFLNSLCAGHKLAEGRRMALVVATDDFRPWSRQGEKFALIKDRQWLSLGTRASLVSNDEPLLREMLGEGSGEYK